MELLHPIAMSILFVWETWRLFEMTSASVYLDLDPSQLLSFNDALS